MKKLLSTLLIFPLFLAANNPFMSVNTPVSQNTGADTIDGNTFTTGSFTPPAHSLLFIVAGHVNGAVRTHNQPTSTINTGTWLFVNSGLTGNGRISVWYAQTTDDPGTGTITQTFSGAVIRKAWIAFTVTGHDRGTFIREDNVGSNTSATLSISMTDEIIGHTLFIGAILSIGAGSIGTGTGGTELVEVSSGSSNEARIEVQYGDNTTFDWSGLNTAGNVAVVWEVNVDPGIMIGGLRIKILQQFSG